MAPEVVKGGDAGHDFVSFSLLNFFDMILFLFN
jgi:hypothetical protein